MILPMVLRASPRCGYRDIAGLGPTSTRRDPWVYSSVISVLISRRIRRRPALYRGSLSAICETSFGDPDISAGGLFFPPFCDRTELRFEVVLFIDIST